MSLRRRRPPRPTQGSRPAARSRRREPRDRGRRRRRGSTRRLGDAGADAAGRRRGPVRPTRAQNRAAKRAAGAPPRRPSARTGPGRRRQHRTSPPSGSRGGASSIGAAVIAFGNPFGGAQRPRRPQAASAAPSDLRRRHLPDEPAGRRSPPARAELVTIETELGDIVIQVDGALSPIAAGNFVALAECEYYDGRRVPPDATLETGRRS